jgi:hypothetical protein
MDPALSHQYLQSDLQGVHVFWTHLVGTETANGGTGPEGPKWPNLAAICAANPARDFAKSRQNITDLAGHSFFVAARRQVAGPAG